jgi:hypothetical protein
MFRPIEKMMSEGISRLGGRGRPHMAPQQIEQLLSETRMHGLSRTIGQPIPGVDAFVRLFSTPPTTWC